MKKKLLLLIILLIPFYINAETISVGTAYGTYTDAQNMIKEVMKSYYLRGDNIQYSFARAITQAFNRTGMSPEEATSQDMQYMVCTTFAYDIYHEAFGMDLSHSTSSFTKVAENYYNTYIKNTTNPDLSGHFLLYYDTKKQDDDTNKPEYIYGTSENFSDFVKLLKPGDIFVHSGGIGHFLVVYDVLKNNKNEIYDALMLNSTASLSPVVSTSMTHSINKISYNKKFTNYTITNLLKSEIEGTVKTIPLSSYGNVDNTFVSGDFIDENGKMKCKDQKCAVIRPFYEDENHNAVFNYELDNEQYAKAKLRTEYPGLVIEKTVDKKDNNNVHSGDTLTYTITVTNRSDVANKEDYNLFTIEEKLGNNVSNFQDLECSIDNTGSDISRVTNAVIDGKKVKWAINEEITPTGKLTIKYSVKVNNLSSDPIKSTGKFYKTSAPNTYISTGTVINKVTAKQYNQTPNFKNCYNTKYNEGKEGLDLIQGVYECAGGDKIDFNNFSFEALIEKENGREVSQPLKEDDPPVINISPKDSNSKQISNIILNNYWGGTVFAANEKIIIPRYTENEIQNKTRAQTINPDDFQDGDILIYRNSSMETQNNSETQPTCKRNIFRLPTDDTGITVSGVTYKTSWETLNLNGTMQPETYSSIKIASSKILFNTNLEVGDQFDISILYVSGSYETESNKQTKLLPRFLDSNESEININNSTMDLPTENNKVVTQTIKVTDEIKNSKGLLFRIYKSDSQTVPVTFNNYTIKIYVNPTIKNTNNLNCDITDKGEKITYESGIYSYVYIKSKGGFVGNNYKGYGNERNSFTDDYYTQNNLSLYTVSSKISDPYLQDEDAKIFMNYQTLLAKDYYVILRPNTISYSFIINKYQSDNNKKLLYRIPAKTTLNEIQNSIDTTGDISVLDKQTQVVTNKIKTGDTLKVSFGIENLEYTLSILGDVTGRGKIDETDVEETYNILKNKKNPEEYYRIAADVTKDNNIKINDVAKLYQYAKGTINSLE